MNDESVAELSNNKLIFQGRIRIRDPSPGLLSLILCPGGSEKIIIKSFFQIFLESELIIVGVYSVYIKESVIACKASFKFLVFIFGSL